MGNYYHFDDFLLEGEHYEGAQEEIEIWSVVLSWLV